MNNVGQTVGSNNHGQLGDGRILQREAPIFIASLFDTKNPYQGLDYLSGRFMV